MMSGVRDMRITRSPPSRFLIADVAMVRLLIKDAVGLDRVKRTV